MDSGARCAMGRAHPGRSRRLCGHASPPMDGDDEGCDVALLMVKWAREHGDEAVRWGNVAVLESLRGRGAPWDRDACMDVAKRFGCFEDVSPWRMSCITNQIKKLNDAGLGNQIDQVRPNGRIKR